ncbi:hypothetical protein GOP47_0016311 [Adiantum capillus-veneris]|uniref:Sacsin/Nov domain-containing protein n=1 Tax=Adiantum capillus-veneris TaxID=13818 RepID=A0A9D4UIH9_ADICA|nr:hypothetical protein GOP47_0016311 [Adiantum capillus-veneris]
MASRMISGSETRQSRARKVVEDIRATKFGIGRSQKNPLAPDMHQAITHLAAELYQKDLHFVMELVQNADDNTYAEGIVPELKFILVEADVANVGVEWTLLVLNNEVGFSQANVESLCSIGLSTKKGKRDSGYIGEKGIGFKSVFLITRHPIVISNGYRIRFNDAPTPETDLGYIVPEWAAQPSDEDLLDCIGGAKLPSTIFVLPIRSDKVQPMREQLFQLSPQLVLFLNKIEKLSVQQLASSHANKSNAAANLLKSMCVQRHRIPSSRACLSLIPNTCSHSVVRLSFSNQEAIYHVWQQEFPVCADHEVDSRRHVKTCMISLAFPLNNKRIRSHSEPDVYAFLPTKISAGLPFLINADFLLVSSRENLRFGSKWNTGILSRIPEAFMAAFMFLLRDVHHLSSSGIQLRSIYSFVPCARLSVPELGFVRDSIIEQMKQHGTILCAGNVGQYLPLGGAGHSDAGCFFCPPHEARVIHPEFGQILELAAKANIPPPKALLCQSTYIVDAELAETHPSLFSVLKVASYDEKEYIQIVRSPAWLQSLTEAMYVEVLYFLMYNSTQLAISMQNLPLIKYLDEKGNTQLLAPEHKYEVPVYISKIPKDELIVSRWRATFQPWLRVQFMPTKTVKAINITPAEKQKSLYTWLKKIANVEHLSVTSFGESLIKRCTERKSDACLTLNAMHFFLHANYEGYLPHGPDLSRAVKKLPLIDNSGAVHQDFSGPILLPASVCMWPRILLHNTWKGDVIFLSESYLKVPSFMSAHVEAEEVVQFLKMTIGASDIFDIRKPPNVRMPIQAPWLSADDCMSFLSWIEALPCKPSNLMASLKESSWVTTMNHGYKKPSQSFLHIEQWNGALQCEDVPVVNAGFYGDLRPFTTILTSLGMVTEVADGVGVNAVAEHVKELAGQGANEVRSDTAGRWYRYLRLHNWMGWSGKSTQKLIWVPGFTPRWSSSSALGSWKCSDECVIDDSGGLFHERLTILSKVYTDELVLAFFQQHMGVAVTPGTEKYCQLWMDWGEKYGFEVTEEACKNAWSIIAKGWKTCSKTSIQFFKAKCRVPYVVSGKIQLARPTEKLSTALAADGGAGGPFANFDSSKLLPPNFQAASVGSKMSCWRLGMYRAILGYLANPEHGLSFQARKRMLMQLENVEVLQVEEVSEVQYTVSLAGKAYKASKKGYARWEKGQKRIYVARPLNACNKVKIAHELAGEVAKGVVGVKRVVLVEGLHELLLLAAGFEFEDSAVQQLLLLRNLRLTVEDDALLEVQG